MIRPRAIKRTNAFDAAIRAGLLAGFALMLVPVAAAPVAAQTGAAGLENYLGPPPSPGGESAETSGGGFPDDLKGEIIIADKKAPLDIVQLDPEDSHFFIDVRGWRCRSDKDPAEWARGFIAQFAPGPARSALEVQRLAPVANQAAIDFAPGPSARRNVGLPDPPGGDQRFFFEAPSLGQLRNYTVAKFCYTQADADRIAAAVRAAAEDFRSRLGTSTGATQ